MIHICAVDGQDQSQTYRSEWLQWPLIVCLFILTHSTQVHAQTKKTAAAKSQDLTLSARDGWPIRITYYPATGSQGKESPVVILLHDKGGNRLIWKRSFARALQLRGYAAIGVDLRKHGESRPTNGGAAISGKTAKSSVDLKPADYNAMVAGDLEAVKKFLLKEHQAEKLNMRKTAIIAAGMTCPVALNFTALDWLKKPYDDAPTLAAKTPRGQDVRALILLSPEQSVSGLQPSVRAATNIRSPVYQISVLICVSSQDKLDRGTSKKIHTQLTSVTANKKRMLLKKYKGRWRGTDLLNKSSVKVEPLMLNFLDKYVKNLNRQRDLWRSRKNKLTN